MTDEAVNTPNTMSPACALNAVSTERRRRTLVRIVDDDPTVRRALTVFLTMDEWPVAAYPSAQSFLDDDDLTVPGCLVLDIRMPGMSGIELHREMIRRGIDLPVIFLSAHGDVEMAVEAIERGAMTFLVKPPQPEKLLETVAKAVAANLTKRREAADEKRLLDLWHGLTAAERRVAVLVGKGLTNAQAAEALGVAERTVRAQRAAVWQKLDVENAVELSEFLHELPPAALTEQGASK